MTASNTQHKISAGRDDRLREFFGEVAAVVGGEFLTFPSPDSTLYKATTPFQIEMLGHVRPASVAELQRLVKLAGEFQVPLYPYSVGNNWGYGTRLPMGNAQLLVDLSRMNRILEVNEELGYVVVEPGVTQGALFQYLTANGSRLRMDPSGAGPNVSLVGNILERGYGIGVYGDHFGASCGMEVVLPEGEVIQTGFWRFGETPAAGGFKWGVGPYLDGLFTQSNYGIVTKLCIWLDVQPESFEGVFFSVASPDQLFRVVPVVRELLADGTINGAINFVHRNRIMTSRIRFPWERVGEAGAMPEALSEELAQKLGIGWWTGMSSLSGSRATVKAAKKVVKARLRPLVESLHFVNSGKIAAYKKLRNWLAVPFFPASALASLSAKVDMLGAVYDLLNGVPTELTLKSPYWRNRKKSPPKAAIDPAGDNCGLIWYAPIVPMVSSIVESFVTSSERIFLEHGFDPCIGLLSVNKRCLTCHAPILYNRDDAREAERALACYRALSDNGKKIGCFPYRVGIQGMESMLALHDGAAALAAKIKCALDPQGIIAPGRYVAAARGDR